jgi:hypothetical protein
MPTLDTLADMEVWQKVTVNTKVVEVKEEFQVSDKIIIANQTGVAKICLWEEYVNCIKEHKSYCLKIWRKEGGGWARDYRCPGGPRVRTF